MMRLVAVLLAGLPVGLPGSTVNRLCGSGLDAAGAEGSVAVGSPLPLLASA